MSDTVSSVFLQKYFKEPLVVRSPGRVNIIGEHIDYNEGFVLPAAIDKSIYIAVSKREDEGIHLCSVDFKEEHISNLSLISPNKQLWTNYILGVVDQLKKRGCRIGGFDAVIDGDVPIGAGLSSSAAVECATIFALNELFELRLDKIEMVKMAQKAEHIFAGVRCGIMDQFASMFGRTGHVIKLDCRSLEYDYVPLRLDGIKIVLFDTNVKHSLASSEYNTRRQQCEQGVSWIKEKHPDVKNLRDATLQMLIDYVLPNDILIYKRCKYVVDEIQRLLGACDDLQNGNIKSLGNKMFQTHAGLSNEYEVSCKELDFLVNEVKSNDAVLGARMMGGGFGGCTINLVEEEAVDRLTNDTCYSYKRATGLDLKTYIVSTGNGSEIFSKKSNKPKILS